MIDDTYTKARLKEQGLAIQIALKPILQDVPKDLNGAPENLKVAICVASQVRNALKGFGIEI